MKETKPHKWSQAIYYVLASIVVLVLILLVAERFFPSRSPELSPKSSRWFSRLQDTPARALSNPAREKILLALNQEKTIGKSKIIYRGLEKNSAFEIDVVILELDPNSFYRYRIQIDAAEKGFRLAGQDFKLISARKSALQIWHLKK